MNRKFLKLMGISFVIVAFLFIAGGFTINDDPPGIGSNIKTIQNA